MARGLPGMFDFMECSPKHRPSRLLKAEFSPEGQPPVWCGDNFAGLMCVLVTLAGSLLI